MGYVPHGVLSGCISIVSYGITRPMGYPYGIPKGTYLWNLEGLYFPWGPMKKTHGKPMRICPYSRPNPWGTHPLEYHTGKSPWVFS